MPNFTRVREDELSQFVPYDDGFEPLEWMEQGPRFSRVAPDELSEFTSRESADDLRAQLRASQDDSFDFGDLARETAAGALEGLGSLGQQAGGLLSFFGADDYGTRLSRGSGQFIAGVDRFADAVGSGNTPSQLTRYFSGQVVNQLPVMGAGLAAARVLGPRAGFGVMTAGAALQSTGGTMSEAYQGYRDQSFSHEDSIKLARYPAAASGILTGLLTRYGGGKGSGAEKLIIELANGALKGMAARKIAKHIAVEGLKEGLFEEGPDELGQGFLAKLTYDPERTLQEIGLNAMEAAGMGTAMSLGIGAGNFVHAGRGGDGGGGTLIPPIIDAISPTESVTTPSIPTDAAQTPVSLSNLPVAPMEDGGVFDVPANPDEPDIAFPEIDAENERIGLSNLRRYMGELDEAPVPLSQAMRVGRENFTAPPPAPDAVAPLSTAETVPTTPIYIPTARAALEANFQGRSMDLSPEDFSRADAHIQAVLGPDAPAWIELADAGVIEASPNPDGTMRVRVAPIQTKGGDTNAQETQAQAEAPQASVLTPTAAPVAPIEQVVPAAPLVEQPVAASASPPPAQPKQATKRESKYERPPDVLDWMEGNGWKIRRLKQKKGQTDDYAEELRKGAKNTPRHFTDRGSAPDIVTQAYNDAHGTDLTTGEFLESVYNAPSKRANDRRAFFKTIKEADSLMAESKQESTFNKDAIAGEKRDKVQVVAAEGLLEGDRFKVKGEKFVVEKVTTRPDDETMVASVRVKDGPKYGTQTVHGDTTIKADPRTLRSPDGKRKTTTDTSFLPDEQGSLGDATPQGWTAIDATPPQRAQGIPAIRALIDQSDFSDDSKFVAQKILDVVEKTGLDPAALSLELSEALPGNRAGSIMGTLIRMIESADAKVLPHEVAHLLRQLMPAADVAAIEQARLDNMPADAPPEVIDGTMTTQQFIDAKIDPKFYPFINLDEYLAHFFADKFAKEQLAKRDAGLMERIQTWLKEIWEAIKSKFRDPAAMDRIYRDMVAGKYKVTPETGLSVEQERGGLQTTKAGAENELALARDAAAQIQSGEDFISQAEPLVGILSKFNVAAFPHALRRALRWNDLSAIADLGKQQAPNATPQSIAQQSDPSRQADLARMAGQQVLLTERRFDNAIADGIKAKAEVRASSFQSRLKDMRAATILRVFNLSAFAQVRTAVQTALNEAVALLEAERGTDLSIANLEGQVRALEGVEQSGVAMEQLLTDMTGVLMVSPEGQALLAGNGTARDIVTFYRDIKRTANQPIQNDQLLAVASFLMNKMPDMRDQLMAAQWAKSPAVVAQVQGSMKGLMDRLKKNPAATIERIMLEREKRVAGAVGAEFLFWQTQKELSKDLESLSLRMKAGEIATAIKIDPDWLAYRQQTLKAQTSFDGKPIDPFRDTNAVLTLKDGTTVGIGANRIVDSTRETKIAVQEIAVAIAKIKAWLDDPANWNDTTYERQQLDLHTLETQMGLHNLQSGHKTPIVVWSMSIQNNVVNQSGSRHEVAARALLGQIDISQDKVDGWLANASIKLADSQRKAMASHSLDIKDTADAATIYKEQVFNELAGSHQNPTGALQVGDRLLSGLTVTAQDIAFLELSSQHESDLVKIMQKYDRVVIADEGGLDKAQVNYRGPLKTRKNMLPRIANDGLSDLAEVSGTAQAFSDYTNGPVLKRDANNKPIEWGPKKTAASLAALNRWFSQLWGADGKFFVSERNFEYSKKTVFDGPGGAFALISDEIRQNPNAYPTLDDIIAKLVTLTSNATPDQVRVILLEEFGRIVSEWHEAVAQDALRVRTEGGEPTSSFNTARGRQLAPSPFYHIGWTDTPGLRAHAASAMSVQVSRYVDALKLIEKDLTAQAAALATKTTSLSGAFKDPDKTARTAKAMEQHNGHAYGDWRNLDGRITMVQNAISDLTNAPTKRSDWDEAWSRLGGAVVGSMVANSATNARNTASIFHVRAIRKAGQSEVMSWMLGNRFSQEQAIRMAASLSWSTPNVAIQAVKGLDQAVKSFIKDKSVLQFWNKLLRGVIHELGRNVMTRIQGFEQMEAAGLLHIPDAQANFDARMADPVYAGLIPNRKAKGVTRGMMNAAALIENTSLALAGAAMPVSGDVATNTAFWKLQHSKYSHNTVFGAKIIALMKNVQRSGLRTFNLAVPHDPTNIISAQELDLSLKEMSALRWMFNAIGLSLDAKAVDFMARFQSDPQAQFLTEDETGRIIEVMVNSANRKSFGGEVKALKNSPKVQQWIAPLMHWNVRQFSEWLSSISIPVEGFKTANTVSDMTKARMAQWTFAVIGAVLSMALPGALSGMRDDMIGRAIRRWFYGSFSQNKAPWEHDSGGEWAQGHLRYTLENVPYVAWIANLMLPQNSPSRSSMEPGLITVKKIQQAGDAVQKLWVTWDLPEFSHDLVKAFAPQDVRAATRFLPSQTGKIQRVNAISLIKRYAPKEMVRKKNPFTTGTNPDLTELSEYGPKMWNAAYNGDMPKLKEAYDEAVAVAKKMGRKKPELKVEQMFLGGNPYNAALKGYLSVDQSRKMLEDMGPGAAAQLRGWEKAFADAASFLLIPAPNLLMEENTEPEEEWQPRDASKIRRYEETVRLRDLVRP